jgi:hypothetical protein
MKLLTTQHLRGPEFVLDYVLRLCLIVGLAGLMVLFWPDGIFRTPISVIPLGDLMWALISMVVGGLAALVVHCVFIETAIVLLRALRPAIRSEESLRASDYVSNHFEMHYESERDNA